MDQQNTPQEKNITRIILLVAIFVVAVGSVGAIWFMLRTTNSKSPSNQNTGTAGNNTNVMSASQDPEMHYNGGLEKIAIDVQDVPKNLGEFTCCDHSEYTLSPEDPDPTRNEVFEYVQQISPEDFSSTVGMYIDVYKNIENATTEYDKNVALEQDSDGTDLESISGIGQKNDFRKSKFSNSDTEWGLIVVDKNALFTISFRFPNTVTDDAITTITKNWWERVKDYKSTSVQG